MNVGVCKFKLRLPENMSLKGKRRVLKSIITQIRNRFNVSVAEIDLFRPGIIKFSPTFVPKDLALILDKNQEKIIGLGSLIVGSNYIKNSKTGKIVDVYEKI